MKPLLLILLLASFAQAQKLEEIKDWKLIKEMSGEIPNHPGLTVELYGAQIARGDNLIKLMVRAEFPGGAPVDVFRGSVPLGFDISSIVRIVGKLEFNCDTLVVKPVSGSAEIYQFNGKKFKSKEPPFAIDSGNVFALYFCEQGEAPKVAPKLKP